MGDTIRTTKEGIKIRDRDTRRSKPDRSCLHGGDCPYCIGNRTFGSKRREPIEEKLSLLDSL